MPLRDRSHLATRTVRVLRRLRTRAAEAPRVARAVKTTAAALLAWVVVGLIPGPWSEYPYYAPLGAVIATSVSVRTSTRQSFQAVAAIGIGAVIARLVDLLPLPSLPSIALVVLAGVLAAGWRALGDSGSWVPTSALFVLIIGDGDPLGYVSAYVGLTLVGALIGVAVSALVPALPLTPAERALERLRDDTAAHLEALAEAAEESRSGTTADTVAEDTGRRLRASRAAATAAVDQAREAARANWAARRHREWRAHQERHADALDRAALAALEAERPVAVSVASPATTDEVREVLARALAAAADLTRRTRDGAAEDEAVAALADALDAVQRAVATERADADGATRPADGVVVALTPLVPER